MGGKRGMQHGGIRRGAGDAWRPPAPRWVGLLRGCGGLPPGPLPHHHRLHGHRHGALGVVRPPLLRAQPHRPLPCPRHGVLVLSISHTLRVPSPDYLAGLRALCDQHGILLIFDEVQTGVGRTGKWFAYQHEGVAPDIMTLAKGLGGGVPIGAMVCTEAVAPGFAPGAHASTFGGNPLACRAGLTVLDTIESEGLLSHVEAAGAYMAEGMARLVEGLDGVLDVRGRGLMRGLGVDPDRVDRAAVVSRARDAGLLLTMAGPDALRLVPPLIVADGDIDEALELLAKAIEG